MPCFEKASTQYQQFRQWEKAAKMDYKGQVNGLWRLAFGRFDFLDFFEDLLLEEDDDLLLDDLILAFLLDLPSFSFSSPSLAGLAHMRVIIRAR